MDHGVHDLDHLRDDQNDALWAARSGGVVGTASVVLPLLDNQHVAHVELFVHPDHRRRSIGASCCRSRRAQPRGRATVLLASPYSPSTGPVPARRS